ncbi:MAG: hypothetical protein JXA69_04140, partial [Phycisphaerae bacterium]|nr:hypothetical protein [Phycisphaerae bacterium]
MQRSETRGIGTAFAIFEPPSGGDRRVCIERCATTAQRIGKRRIHLNGSPSATPPGLGIIVGNVIPGLRCAPPGALLQNTNQRALLDCSTLSRYAHSMGKRWFQRWTDRLRQPRWDDIDWCDQYINASALTDGKILDALSKVHPYSTALGRLLDEAASRKLAAALPSARRRLDHSDPSIAGSAAAVIQEFGDASDVAPLLERAESPADHYELAAMLQAIVTLEPALEAKVLALAARNHDDRYFDDDYAMAAVITHLSESLPDDSPGLQQRLLDWAVDARLSPVQRARVFERLARMPRTQAIEDFFVAFCVNDDGRKPDLRK